MKKEDEIRIERREQRLRELFNEVLKLRKNLIYAEDNEMMKSYYKETKELYEEELKILINFLRV